MYETRSEIFCQGVDQLTAVQSLPLSSKGPEQVVVLHPPAPAAVVTRTAMIEGGMNHSFVPDMFD